VAQGDAYEMGVPWTGLPSDLMLCWRVHLQTEQELAQAAKMYPGGWEFWGPDFAVLGAFWGFELWSRLSCECDLCRLLSRAAQTVTVRSTCQVNGYKILPDRGCTRASGCVFDRNLNFRFDVTEPMRRSVAHTDHSGNLPNLVKNADNRSMPRHRPLANITLLIRHIQEVDAGNINLKNVKRAGRRWTVVHNRAPPR
jgi:hypothetical protein